MLAGDRTRSVVRIGDQDTERALAEARPTRCASPNLSPVSRATSGREASPLSTSRGLAARSRQACHTRRPSPTSRSYLTGVRGIGQASQQAAEPNRAARRRRDRPAGCSRCCPASRRRRSSCLLGAWQCGPSWPGTTRSRCRRRNTPTQASPATLSTSRRTEPANGVVWRLQLEKERRERFREERPASRGLPEVHLVEPAVPQELVPAVIRGRDVPIMSCFSSWLRRSTGIRSA